MSLNPFLVLGASFDAEVSDLERFAKMRLMELSLDDKEHSPEARLVDAALDQLRDPVRRYEHGLCGLQLTPEQGEQFRADPVLSNLATDIPGNVADHFLSVLADMDPVSSAHNWGMLSYALACHQTEIAQSSTPDDMTDDLQLVPVWRTAFESIKKASSDPTYWPARELHAKCIDDPRLAPEAVREINARFWNRLISPLSGIISTALEQRHYEVATAFVGVVQGSPAPVEVQDAVLSQVYKPLTDRVEHRINGLSDRLSSAASNANAADTFKALFSEFERDCWPDLEMMILVGDLPGYAEEHARDVAAEFLRSLSIASWNNSNAEKVARNAIRLAQKIADSGSLRERLASDLSTLNEAVAQQKRQAKLTPLQEELSSAIQGERWATALSVIDRMIPLEDQSGAHELRKLKEQIQGHQKAVAQSDLIDRWNRGQRLLAMHIEAHNIDLALSQVRDLLGICQERRNMCSSSGESIFDILRQQDELKEVEMKLLAVRSSARSPQTSGCLVPIAVGLLIIFLGAAS